MILSKLHRPDRNLLRLICHPERASLNGEVFEFTGPFFIREVFINLPSKEVDLSILDSAFLNDTWFQELPLLHGEDAEREELKASLRPISIEHFVDLLQVLRAKLVSNKADGVVKIGYRKGALPSGGYSGNRRTSEDTYIKKIDESLDFIRHSNGVYTLEFYYADEWL